EGDGHLAEHLVLLAVKQRVLLHVHHHVEVARRAALVARLAFAGQAHARARVDAGGNLHRQLAHRLGAAGATAGAARVGHHGAGAAALRAGARHREEALGEAHLTGAAAGGALAPLAGLAAGAIAVAAALRPGNLDLHLGAEGRLFEGELQVVAEVGAAVPAAALPAAAAEDVAE